MIEPKPAIKNLFRDPPAFEDRVGKVFRFDRNERTTPLTESHMKAILATIVPEEMVAYLEPEPLYRKMATWLKISRDQLLLASGSDTAIRAVFEVYVREGDEVVMLNPTYGMYVVYAQMFGARAVEVGYNDDLFFPVERILAAISPRTRMIALADPNHTGTFFEPSDLQKIIEEAQARAIVILIDEAYFHFYNRTVLPLIGKYDNLIVIRTFSKAWGIAPLRVGYIVSQKQNIQELYKVKLSHEITLLAYKSCMYLLDHPEILEEYCRDVAAAKEVLYRRLLELDFEVLPSVANFIYFKPPEGVDGKKIMEALKERRLMLKGPFGAKPFSGHLRVTVGSVMQSNLLCDALAEILESFKNLFRNSPPLVGGVRGGGKAE